MRTNIKKIAAVGFAIGAVATTIVAVTASAGSTGNPNDNYRSEPRPAAELVSALKLDSDTASADEYQHAAAALSQSREQATAGMTPMFLEGISKSRVLPTGTGERVALLPVNNGEGMCQVRSSKGEKPEATCSPVLDSNGAMLSWEYGDQLRVYGVAADDVSDVIVHLGSGKSVHVAPKSNLFDWTSADTADSIASVETVRGDLTFTTKVGDPRGK